MPRALIIGVESELGAYLARLLDARGYALAGTARGALARLDDLGVREALTLVAIDDVGSAAAAVDEVYDLGGDAALTARLLADRPGAARLCHVMGAGSSADDAARAGMTAARGAGRFVATATLLGHASRLSDPAHPALRVVRAARDAVAGGAPLGLDDPEAARDLGWSPEYVDALWRTLRSDAPGDYVIATGVTLSDRDIARHALDYFGGDPERIIPAATAATSAGQSPRAGDPGPALATLGWRAYTSGRDLVRTLCEGLAQ